MSALLHRGWVMGLIGAAAAAVLGLAGCRTGVEQPTSVGVAVTTPDGTVSVVFSDADRRTVSDYYGARQAEHLPPGLSKKGRLPPGLATHVRKHGTLPPGLARRSLPSDLECQLAPLPEGHVRVVIGADVAILNVRTQVIADVIKGIAHP